MENRFTDTARMAMNEVRDSVSTDISRFVSMNENEFAGLLPATTDRGMVRALKEVVDKAAVTNMSQAQIVENVRKLGQPAVELIGLLLPGLRM
ncbi:MAG: hypothetical protein K2G01_04145 [Paramuribaculum sp.]|nr:hypothetical protein [Paramuribaculum sp.]